MKKNLRVNLKGLSERVCISENIVSSAPNFDVQGFCGKGVKSSDIFVGRESSLGIKFQRRVAGLKLSVQIEMGRARKS